MHVSTLSQGTWTSALSIIEVDIYHNHKKQSVNYFFRQFCSKSIKGINAKRVVSQNHFCGQL